MTNHKNAPNGNRSAMLLPGLNGERVVVTAGASGIGFAIAELLQEQGVRIAICDINDAALDKASLALGGCMVLSDKLDGFAADPYFW